MLPELSIVLPFYNEEGCVVSVIEELNTVLLHAGISYEIIAIDNGSSDATPILLKDALSKFDRLIVLSIAKNEGYGNGILNGMALARGQIVGFMSADGQVDPDVIPLLVEKMHVLQADVAMGRRIRRSDPWHRQL